MNAPIRRRLDRAWSAALAAAWAMIAVVAVAHADSQPAAQGRQMTHATAPLCYPATTLSIRYTAPAAAL